MELIQLKRANTINKDICNNCKNMNKHCAGVNIPSMICTNCISICLDNLGYRKQSEVIKEVLQKAKDKALSPYSSDFEWLALDIIEEIAKEYGVEL